MLGSRTFKKSPNKAIIFAVITAVFFVLVTVFSPLVSSAAINQQINYQGKSTNPFDIYAGATNLFTVLSGGKIGIGTTTPGFKLTVAGPSNFTNAISGGNIGVLALNLYHKTSKIIRNGTENLSQKLTSTTDQGASIISSIGNFLEKFFSFLKDLFTPITIISAPPTPAVIPAKVGIQGPFYHFTNVGVSEFELNQKLSHLEQSLRALIFGSTFITNNYTTYRLGGGSNYSSSFSRIRDRLDELEAGGGGGNPFDQSLNIADSPTFSGLSLGSLSLTGALSDGNGSSGIAGYILQSTGTSTGWVATSSLGISGSGSGTVNSGVSGYFGYYPSTGTTIDDQSILYTNGTNIGIGTTTPGSLLTVVGTSTLRTILPETTLTYNLGSSAQRFNEGWMSTLNVGTSTWSITQGTAGRFSVFDAASGGGTERLTILPTSGNVGIGTTTPSQQLEITKSIGLADTINSSTGVIYKNGVRFIHNYASSTADGYNTFIGLNAGNFTMSSSAWSGYASYNTAVGQDAFTANTSGYANAAVGTEALQSNTTGFFNSAFGRHALWSNTTGSYNTAVGLDAMRDNATGTDNTAVGMDALVANLSSYNTAVGSIALMFNTTGEGNTALGYQAFQFKSTGDNSIALGINAARLQADGATGLESSTNSIYLGANVRGFDNNDNNAIVIGAEAVGLGANTVVLGNDSIIKTALKGNVGIGTTTPGSLLTVAGTSNITGAATFGSTLGVTGQTTLGNASTTNFTVSTDSYLGTVRSGTWNGTAIPVLYGGTGQTTYTDGQLLIGNTSGNTLTKTTLTGTTNQVVVTNGNGSITLSTPQDIGISSTPTFASTTLSNFTLGSIPFFATGGSLNQNNSNFFWDNTNSSLGIGTSTGSSVLSVIGATPSTGNARQILNILGGNGASGTNANTGIGSALSFTSGNGGTVTSGAGNGKAGGAFSFISGTGGDGGPDGGTGGTGGSFTFTAGNGGTTNELVVGVSGGSLTFNPGAGGFGGLENGPAGNIILSNLQGKVGIGTTTPGYLLTVAGTSNFANAMNFNGNAGSSGYILQSLGSGSAPSWVATSTLGIQAAAGTLTGTTLASNVVSSSLTSLGTIGTGVWQGTTIGPTFGGTGFNTYATGDLLFGSTTANVLAKRAIGITGDVLSVVGGVPTWVATSTLGISGGSGVFTLDGSNNIYSSNAAVPLGTDNFFVGLNAGLGNDVTLTDSIFIGEEAGSGATYASGSTFIGNLAGKGATEAVYSIFIGLNAGVDATNAISSLFIGSATGLGAAGANNAVMIGNEAGAGATGASYSLLIGSSAGNSAINASFMTAIGFNAGSSATNAANSIFIGTGAGSSDTVDNTVSGHSIAIGDNSGTGGFKDSIAFGTGVINSAVEQLNIGNVLYGAGLYKSTFPTALPNPGGSLGIGMVPTATPTVLGAEKINNGTFTGSASSWTLGSGYTYSGNLVRHSVNGTAVLSQTSAAMATPLVPGEYYSLTFTLSNYLGSFVGSVTPAIGGNAVEMTARTSAGTYTETFQALTTDNLTFAPSNAARFQIDDVTLKKIGGMGDLYVAGNVAIGTSSLSARLDVYGAAGSGDIFAISSSTNARLFTVTAGGNVGIGTSTPGSLLTVVGTSTLRTILPETTLAYNLGSSAQRFNEGWMSTLNVGTSTWSMTQSAGERFSIFNAASGGGTERLSIASSTGNVGIGTTTPDQLLVVSGTIRSTDLLGGATTLSTDASGNIIRTPSDLKLKERIQDIDSADALDKILALEGVTYYWKDKTRFGKDQEIGFIAQQVEGVVPQVVKNGGDYKSLNYGNLTVLLAGAIKEQQKQITQNASSTISSLSSLSNHLNDQFSSFDTRLSYLESIEEISPSGDGTIDLGDLWSALQSFGTEIMDGIAYLQKMFVENLTIGSRTHPSGITLYDQVTGEPYCVVIVNGEIKNNPGECPDVTASSTPLVPSIPPNQNPEPAGDTSTSTQETPPDESSTSTVPDIIPEPPAPDPAPAPETPPPPPEPPEPPVPPEEPPDDPEVSETPPTQEPPSSP